MVFKLRKPLAVPGPDIDENYWSASDEPSVPPDRIKFRYLGGICDSACDLCQSSFRKYGLLCGTGQVVSSLQKPILV
jgi:hypothetical protein